MSDLLAASLVFALLCAAAGAGYVLVVRLPVFHRTPEALGFVRYVTGLLLTFTSLVLGLLIAGVNADFGKTEGDMRSFGAALIQLTAALDDVGPQTRPIRADLRRYAAAVQASTWPEEPRPSGDYPKALPDEGDFDAPDLGALLHGIGRSILALPAADATQAAMRDNCFGRLKALEAVRWTLVGDAHGVIPPPFHTILLFWLVVIFASFGLVAPRVSLSVAAVVLVAACVGGAVFVLYELDGPLDGLVKVSSEPVRHALRHLDRSLAAAPATP